MSDRLSVIPVNPSFWCGKKVLLTGHTGFKGGWLSIWLKSMGVQLYGLALNPTTIPNLFDYADISKDMKSTIGDIRSYEAVLKVVSEIEPEIVIHMAAQPLVRYSYHNPIETYATNVMGVVHLFEAIRKAGSVRVVLNVTTDKCYENKEWIWGYREDDAMGGFDPYSNSKGCSELVTSAYRHSYFDGGGVALASARAGNVIGGGDWSCDRLIPDVIKAFELGESVIIRNPNSIRPWQHVLEPLSGYLLLCQKLWEEPNSFKGGWNFGPKDEDTKSVHWVVKNIAKRWGHSAQWEIDTDQHPHEANFLKLDISKAMSLLRWKPRWSLEIALDKTIDWNVGIRAGRSANEVCLNQIQEYLES